MSNLLMVLVFGMVVFLSCSSVWGNDDLVLEDSQSLYVTKSDNKVFDYEIQSISSSHAITFTHPDGREAIIDFGKDGKVSYSGELPVDESAKLFFEAFGNLIAGALKEKHED